MYPAWLHGGYLPALNLDDAGMRIPAVRDIYLVAPHHSAKRRPHQARATSSVWCFERSMESLGGGRPQGAVAALPSAEGPGSKVEMYCLRTLAWPAFLAHSTFLAHVSIITFLPTYL